MEVISYQVFPLPSLPLQSSLHTVTRVTIKLMWGYALLGNLPMCPQVHAYGHGTWILSVLAVPNLASLILISCPHFFPSLVSQVLIIPGHFGFLKYNVFFYWSCIFTLFSLLHILCLLGILLMILQDPLHRSPTF